MFLLIRFRGHLQFLMLDVIVKWIPPHLRNAEIWALAYHPQPPHVVITNAPVEWVITRALANHSKPRHVTVADGPIKGVVPVVAHAVQADMAMAPAVAAIAVRAVRRHRLVFRCEAREHVISVGHIHNNILQIK